MRILIIENPDASALELILKSGYKVFVQGEARAEVPVTEKKEPSDVNGVFSVESDSELLLRILSDGEKSGVFLTDVFASRLSVAKSTARRRLGATLAKLVREGKIRKGRENRFAIWSLR